MFDHDLAFALEDLAALGAASVAQILRAGQRVRNPRGVPLNDRTPLDGEDNVPCWLSESDDQWITAGYGAAEDAALYATFPCGTDVQGEDVIAIVHGPECGKSYRVLQVRGLQRHGEARVAALARKTG